MVEAYGRRNLYDYFEKGTEELTEELESQPYRDGAFYLEMFELKNAVLNHPDLERHQIVKNDFIIILNYLDLFFCYEKLKLACELNTREKIISEKYDIWLLEEILNKVDQNSIGLLSIYSNSLALIKTPNKRLYYDFKNKYISNFSLFKLDEKQNFLQCLINFAISQTNLGLKSFYKELFELYKVGIENKLFLFHEKLPHMIYTNIAYTSILVNEFEWSRKYLDKYEKLVDEKFRLDTRVLCLSYLFYQKKALLEALDLLNDYYFKNDFYQFKGRILHIRILFEMFVVNRNYYNLLCSKLEAFEKYLHRNHTVTAYKTIAYLEFTKTVKKIIKVIIEPCQNINKKKNLLIKINQSTNVTSKYWLINQINKI